VLEDEQVSSNVADGCLERSYSGHLRVIHVAICFSLCQKHFEKRYKSMTIHLSVGIPPSQTLWLQNKEALSGAVENLLSRTVYLLHLTLRHCSEFEFICSQHGFGLSEKSSLQSQIALQSLNILQVRRTDFAKNEDGEGQTIYHQVI
jgi:hypothetical protein